MFLRTTCLTFALLGALTLTTAAHTPVTDTFTGGENLGGWTFGSGNGQFLTTPDGEEYFGVPDLFSGVPKITTTSEALPFLGNWSAGWVLNLSVDMAVFSTSLTGTLDYRFVTIQVVNDNGTPGITADDWGAWYETDQLVPAPPQHPGDATWHNYSFPVASRFLGGPDEVPAGWTSQLQGHTWAELMADVDRVAILTAPVNVASLPFDWDIGVDNIRITRATFVSHGPSLDGSAGTPLLTGEGTLMPETSYTLTFTNGLPNTTAYLVLGLAVIEAPFKGGVLVPRPDLIVPFDTGATGGFELELPWIAAIAPGTILAFQVWIPDPAGVFGFASTNGLVLTAP